MGRVVEKDGNGRVRLGVEDGKPSTSVLSLVTGPDDSCGLEVNGSDIVARIGALETAGTANLATDVSANAYAAYVEALTVAADYHATTNERNWGEAALASFVGGAGSPSGGELTALYARVNQVKADLVAHLADVATRAARGQHLAEDDGNSDTLEAVPAASSAATACTLTIAIDACIIAHGTQSGVHFHDDSTLNGYSVSSDLLAANATADKCRIEINAVIVALKTHADGAVPA